MKHINIAATEKSPRVTFDPKKYLFEMEGNSRPENVRDFFYPLIDNLKEYFDSIIYKANHKEDESIFNFNFKLEYFNSASAKFISDILVIVKNCHDNGIKIKINWYFEDGDEDMKEVGEDFSEMIAFPFNFIMVKR
ncbi:MAG: hypothetical protein A2W99_04885 [Bacteroidetes bacterium GWF2_33_16]|nr:MAG: hypothetical protein A2X00_17405 [Bacteroidetes bacterium GWE2_32_14]OFY06002.1 MAG: hypothetical protein A2W99_04885 [Bacteroidetes bacterium GWF2_33_16]